MGRDSRAARRPEMASVMLERCSAVLGVADSRSIENRGGREWSECSLLNRR